MKEYDHAVISRFAFDLGKLMGSTHGGEGEICDYLRERGIYTDQIEEFHKAALVLAGAFYRDPK